MPKLSLLIRRPQLVLGFLGMLIIIFLLIINPRFGQNSMSTLERIQQSGKLRVLTVNSASTYYYDHDGPNGFEFELATLFAEFIGVSPEFIIVPQFSDLYPALLSGSGDIIAAGLSVDESEVGRVLGYGPRYFEASNQVLYRKGVVNRPRKIADLTEGVLQVVSGTGQVKLLTEIQQDYPQLIWQAIDDAASEELIEKVDLGEIPYLLTDSHQIALQRPFFPELRIGFEIGKPRQFHWVFDPIESSSFANTLHHFFEQINDDGQLEQLVHRHYSHVAKFNYSDIQTFTTHIKNRLPDYERLFRREAKAVDLDWRLIASIGYQESLWIPNAVSPTGVRGLMMLTQATAKQMKVKNRLNPEQSIRGGAAYFSRVLKRIPPSITEPDRSWFALASYNVGFGHVQDARKITEQNGGNPNRWIDVKKSLPLLARKKWYKKTKYGYARGWEPVKYVANIRKYYEYLTGLDLRKNQQPINSKKNSATQSLAPSL